MGGVGGMAGSGGMGGEGGGPVCSAASASVDCDDGNTCTDDTCPTGICVYESSPNGAPCGVGQHCDGIGSCVSVTAIWAKSFGAAQDQSSHNIAVDSSGNVAMTGSYQNVIDFGGGGLPQSIKNDAFLANLDPTAQHRWAKAFSSSTQESAGNDVSFDGLGNTINAGGLKGTVNFGGGPLDSPWGFSIYAAKYAPDGTHVWSKQYGQAGGIGAAYQSDVDDAGNVYLGASYSAGIVDFGCGPLVPAGDYDALVAKLDPAGNCLWSKRFGDAAFQQTSGAAVDASGNVIITGILNGTTDFGGGPLTSNGGQDVFVAKFDAVGNHLWSKRFGSAGNQLGMGIATSKTGDIAIIGYFGGTLDFDANPMISAGGEDGFVAVLDASGKHVWSRRIGGSQNDGVRSAAFDNWGNVGIIGYFVNTIDLGDGPLQSAGGFDIMLAKYSGADGKHLWSARFGDAANQVGQGIAFDAKGYTHITGDFVNSVDFGTGPLISTGGIDVFVAKFPP